MRWLALVLALLVTLPAWAADFEVPGLERDSQAYVDQLSKRVPAGMTPQARRQAEQRAADALKRNDWAGAATALEQRLAGGDGTAEQWLALGRAQLQRTPPDAARAAQAGWQAYSMLDDGVPEVPALLLIADAFRAMQRYDYAIRALEAVQERVPDDKRIPAMLTEVRQLAGIQVRQVRTEPEADPAQTCISFTTAPARRADFVPGDWVRLQPARPDAAITRQGDQICVAGLPRGETTRVTLLAGMPGEDGLKLNKDTVLPVAVPNRKPRIIFDSRLFILPHDQAPRVTLTTVNLSKVKLQLLRLTERNAINWTGSAKPSDPLQSYDFSNLSDHGKIVWEGTADIPSWQQNRTVRTALPLPDAFGEPGVYLLSATAGDGTDTDSSAVQVVVRTDLAPTVWRGQDGLTVQVRSYADASVRPGVALRLIAASNDILAEAVTDSDGVARFAAPLLRGTGPQAPQAIHGMAHGTGGDEFVTLDLTAASFDLSDRGVEGAAQPGPLDAYAWTDRGIYRPGETVQVMALLRDAAGAPRDVPAHLVIKRPNGQVLIDQVPPREAEDSVRLPVALPLTAPAGEWTVEVLADPKAPPIGRATFRVDAFVPDRMAVEAQVPGPIVVGQPMTLPVVARFLYGAPAANLTADARLQLEVDPDGPAPLKGFRIGLEGEVFAPDAMPIEMPNTDAQGKTGVPILLKTAPDSTRPLRATVVVSVDDPSGRASRAVVVAPVKPAGRLIGIKPLFNGAVDAGGEAGFDVAAVNADGAQTAVPAALKLVRERPDWRLVTRGSVARYETVYRDEPIEQAQVTLPASGVFHYAKRLDYGRYRLEVSERGGLAATSVRFRAGWAVSDSPDTPDKVDVSLGKKAYAPGETARVHVVAPFAGHATVLVATDRVFSLKDVDVAAGGTDIDIPVDAAWGPGAYATVHVFHAGGGTASSGPARPSRAIGVAWIAVDPAARTLKLTIGAADKVAPRQRITVPVRTEPGAWVTVAAVDEGILKLTGFVSPDPGGHYFGRRRLGLDIRDDWGRLIAPAEGDATLLKQGGDDGGSALPEIPQKTVSLFVPPMQAGADGVANVSLDLPDFAGQVRLMAVAWQGTKVGSASQDMIVRDALIAEPLLPRFLAPGDESRLGVLLQNLELPPGEVSATVSVDGPLQVSGETRLAANAGRDQVVRTTTLKATGAGRGVVRLDVSGPGGFHVQRETGILIRPARAPITVAASTELPGRSDAALQPVLDQMVPGTGRARAVWGGPVRYDVAAMVQALADYPLLCLEQASSKGFPLAMLPDGPVAGADRAARLQTAVWSVLDRQRFDGGFGLWSSNGEAETWLSAYATEFLIRAQRAGAAVPEAGLRDALKFLGDQVEQLNSTETAQGLADLAYDSYVLAMAGKPRAGVNRMLAERAEKLPTPLARAQAAAALALSNDKPRAEAMFTAALASPARKDWFEDRGSAVRDQFAIAVLLKESGLLPEKLAALLGTLPGAELKADTLSTQEQAWAVAAAAALGRDGRPARIALDGKDLPQAPTVGALLSGPARARNLDDRPVWQTVSTTGVPSVALPAARNQMRVSRQFFTLAGAPLDLSQLRQNTVFVLLVEGRSDDGQEHQSMLLQGLPAGWEVAGRLQGGKVPGMPWLGELSETESQPASDDRFAATMMLNKGQPSFRVAVRLRAVTPGDYELPGAQLSDMYRPDIFARQGSNRVKVQAAE